VTIRATRAPGAATVTIRDAAGAAVRTLTSTGSSAGINLVEWDLRQAPSTGDDARPGAVVTPGAYTIEVRQGANTAAATLQVVR